MYKKPLLVLVLLTSALWLQAQAGYPQSDANQIGQTDGNSGRQTSVEGCLQGSNGNYTLTADSGSVYQLTAHTSKLSEHVGHEVRITGTTSGSGTAASPSATTPGASQSVLEVKSIKHISKTCSKPMSK
jgi:hypothetical protein